MLKSKTYIVSCWFVKFFLKINIEEEVISNTKNDNIFKMKSLQCNIVEKHLPSHYDTYPY